jgi:hypothetical protein
MKKFLILVILLTIPQTSFSTEVNLNGLKIKLKDNQEFSKDLTFEKYLRASWLNANVTGEMADTLWKDQIYNGFDENDKVLIISPRSYIRFLNEINNLSDGELTLDAMNRSPTMIAAQRYCAKETSKKKYFRCFVQNTGMSYQMTFSYATNSHKIFDELDDTYKGDFKKFSRDLKKIGKEITKNSKFLKFKSIKAIIGANKNGDSYIEMRAKSSLGGLGTMKTRIFTASINGKILSAKIDCLEEAYCKKMDAEFMDIFLKTFALDGKIISADLSKEEELIEFINTSKKAYRAAQIARILIMLL